MTLNGKGVKRLSEIVLPVYQGEFWQTRKTYVLCKGSRGSGKSKAAALWHIVHMMQLPLSNTLVVRKVERTLRDSCFSDLQWAIRRLGVEKFWNCTVSPLEMSYKPTGQKILFRGLDDGYKITSISVPHGVLNFLICWMNPSAASYRIVISSASPPPSTPGASATLPRSASLTVLPAMCWR